MRLFPRSCSPPFPCDSVRVQLDSQPEVIDQLERKRMQLEVEQHALMKEKDQGVLPRTSSTHLFPTFHFSQAPSTPIPFDQWVPSLAPSFIHPQATPIIALGATPQLLRILPELVTSLLLCASLMFHEMSAPLRSQQGPFEGGPEGAGQCPRAARPAEGSAGG